MKELEENVQKYQQFIENLSNNFSIYHDLIEQKFSNLLQNASNGEDEIGKYKEMVERIQRESQQIQQTQMEEYGQEINKYKDDLDRLKNIEKEYDHLNIEHKHLSQKYETLLNDSRTRTRSISHTMSIDSNKSGENDIGKLKDEIYDLRQKMNGWQHKWDELRHTPAKYYINDIDQKHRFSVDQYKHYWGMGLDNIDAKWRKK